MTEPNDILREALRRIFLVEGPRHLVVADMDDPNRNYPAPVLLDVPSGMFLPRMERGLWEVKTHRLWEQAQNLGDLLGRLRERDGTLAVGTAVHTQIAHLLNLQIKTLPLPPPEKNGLAGPTPTRRNAMLGAGPVILAALLYPNPFLE